MPKDIEHFKKYESNKRLLKSNIFKIEETPYLDWFITITFYGALHLVEKKLHELTGKDSRNHQERKINILKTRQLLPISAQYQTLYNQSMRARYDCCEFTIGDAKKAIELLNEIETIIA
ncbi:hypothetical protein [Paramaledivibacter caminithermalis]|jgi:hypothetical protein|uniref:HEPN domain-containing protein n=1 Tax=Paramaledivibacter caminithermalis (strain DSM 15212 / CIP 107654 / DViRD3) TaxID=1121301 RepID=A0A1M6Q7S6_PARC5|nr:hypothetical protein [Paramaledivibacter caminithermalis]SHK16167.1 hypothetical protein SAMN02745912_02453 [Paramaledivibacter caminithermalis DSM 15212]